MRTIDHLKILVGDVAHLFQRREVRVIGAMMILAMASTTLSAQSTGVDALATSLGADGQKWIYWLIRIMGGLMSLGGLWALIVGISGNAEGLKKACEVGGGVILMLVGCYCLLQTPAIYNNLGLAKMFTTT